MSNHPTWAELREVLQSGRDANQCHSGESRWGASLARLDALAQPAPETHEFRCSVRGCETGNGGIGWHHEQPWLWPNHLCDRVGCGLPFSDPVHSAQAQQTDCDHEWTNTGGGRMRCSKCGGWNIGADYVPPVGQSPSPAPGLPRCEHGAPVWTCDAPAAGAQPELPDEPRPISTSATFVMRGEFNAMRDYARNWKARAIAAHLRRLERCEKALRVAMNLLEKVGDSRTKAEYDDWFGKRRAWKQEARAALQPDGEDQ